MWLIAADAATTVPNWAIQLGIATPFILALAFLGKWLLQRLDTLEKEKNDLYNKMINDVLPAVTASTDVAEDLLQVLKAREADQEVLEKKREDIIVLQQQLLQQSEDLRKQERNRQRRESSAS